jgi:hypothetical protein
LLAWTQVTELDAEVAKTSKRNTKVGTCRAKLKLASAEMECRHFDSEGTRGEKQRHGGEALGEAAHMLLYSNFLLDLIFVPHVKCAALAQLTTTLPLFGDGSPLHYDASSDESVIW